MVAASDSLVNMKTLLVFVVGLAMFTSINGIENCPLKAIKSEVETISNYGFSSSLAMEFLPDRIENEYGGSWGVIIVDDPELMNDVVHWTIPGGRFCVTVVKGKQYNIFKKGFVGAMLTSKDGLENCPLRGVKSEVETIGNYMFSSVFAKQLLQDRIENEYGGSWAVVIVDDPELVNDVVHWTIPVGGLFCVTVVEGKQYNIFKVGTYGRLN